MKIGIDASRAFLPQRTGIEEYAYRVIEHLRDELPSDVEVILYVRQVTNNKLQKKNFQFPISNFQSISNDAIPQCLNKEEDAGVSDLRIRQFKIDSKFKIQNSKFFSNNWRVREIPWKRFWTQGGLAWEMFRRPVDVLFVPAHTVPWIHPKKTVVVVHGLEYEFCPGAYSLWERWYMRITIWLSCRWAHRIVAVSENTKRDLMRLYGVAEEKIRVIYEGVSRATSNKQQATGGNNPEFPISNFDSNQNERIIQFSDKKQAKGVSDSPPSVIASSRSNLSGWIATSGTPRNDNFSDSKFQIPRPLGGQATSKFLLFIGRIEERKNVVRIVEAFEMLKEKYKIPHTLVLAGKDGYGSDNAKLKIKNSKWRKVILLTGYISEKEKAELLRGADVFVFPSLYEGFGLPILEAQAVGVPVVTSNISSMPEVVQLDQRPTTNNQQLTTNDLPPTTYHLPPALSAVLVDPQSASSIAEGIYSILSDNKKREHLVSLGYENVKRFSWAKCSARIANILTNDSRPTTHNQ